MAVAFTGCLIIIVCRLIRMLSACNDAGDMVLLPTQVASLSCPCQPQTDYIYINESSNAITPTTYYNEFNVVDMCDNGAIACIVITFSDTLAYNSTQIRCTHSDSNYPNDVASYFVAGPPLSPSPSVLVINTSALLLQWEEPFTWKGVADIIYYTVRMYNVSAHKWMRWDIPALLHGNLYCASSDGNGLFNTNCSEETNVDAVTNTTVQFIFTTTSIPFYRDELIFFVSASNIVGESERAAVRGWIKSASYNNNMKVLITPLQQADNEVAVLIISIQFPSSCIPQTTNLNISVRNMQNLSSHGVLKQIPIEGSPNDWITFRPHLDLIMNGVIEVIVTASTSEGNAYASIIINSSENSGNYDSCSIDCEDHPKIQPLCLLQLTVIPIMVAVVCVIITGIFILVFWLRSGGTGQNTRPVEQVNPFYNDRDGVLYDYIEHTGTQFNNCK